MKRKHTDNKGKSKSRTNKRKFPGVDCPLDTVDGYLTRTYTKTVCSQSGIVGRVFIRALVEEYSGVIVDISSRIETLDQRRHRAMQFSKIKSSFDELNRRHLNIIDRSPISEESSLSLSEFEEIVYVGQSVQSQ